MQIRFQRNKVKGGLAQINAYRTLPAGSRSEEVHTEAAAGIHVEHADVVDWPRSLLGSALPRQGAAGSGL